MPDDPVPVENVPAEPSTPTPPWKQHHGYAGNPGSWRTAQPHGEDPTHTVRSKGLPAGTYRSPDADPRATEPPEPAPEQVAARDARAAVVKDLQQVRAATRGFLAQLPGCNPEPENAQGLLARAYQAAADRVKQAQAAAQEAYETTTEALRLKAITSTHQAARVVLGRVREEVTAAREKWRQAVASGDAALTGQLWGAVAKLESDQSGPAAALAELAPSLAQAQRDAQAVRDRLLRDHLRQLETGAGEGFKRLQAEAAAAAAGYFERAETERLAVLQAEGKLRQLPRGLPQ
jgi:hypothetical protein